MKRLIISSICLLYLSSAFAQSISQTVIGSQGTFYDEAASASLTFTVGELATAYYANETAILGQGFHHTYSSLLVSTITPFLDWEVTAFPNPTADRLVLQVPEAVRFRVDLFSAIGQKMAVWQLEDLRSELDLSIYPAGTYFLRITDEDGKSMTMQVMKIGR